MQPNQQQSCTHYNNTPVRVNYLFQLLHSPFSLLYLVWKVKCSTFRQTTTSLLLHCPKSNTTFRDITWNILENEILHEIFCVVSRFPQYISCSIAENRLTLGQCICTQRKSCGRGWRGGGACYGNLKFLKIPELNDFSRHNKYWIPTSSTSPPAIPIPPVQKSGPKRQFQI